MLWTLPIIPICVGLLVWLIGRRWTPPRLLLGGIAAATTATLGGLAG